MELLEASLNHSEKVSNGFFEEIPDKNFEGISEEAPGLIPEGTSVAVPHETSGGISDNTLRCISE